MKKLTAQQRRKFDEEDEMVDNSMKKLESESPEMAKKVAKFKRIFLSSGAMKEFIKKALPEFAGELALYEKYQLEKAKKGRAKRERNQE